MAAVTGIGCCVRCIGYLQSIVGFDRKLKIDDPVGAISVHGVCGFLGLMVSTAKQMADANVWCSVAMALLLSLLGYLVQA